MKHIKLFGLLAACCLALATVSCTKEDYGGNDGSGGGGKQDSGTEETLKGTTWATGEQLGLGTLTLSFTNKDATLKRVSDGKTTSCTYPYTYKNGTMKTKGKLLNDQEQDVTGTVSGTTMNVTFSKSGNYVFSKK
jgi:major membrane immunogen (membrane-anchored lipoprotein)